MARLSDDYHTVEDTTTGNVGEYTLVDATATTAIIKTCIVVVRIHGANGQ